MQVSDKVFGVDIAIDTTEYKPLITAGIETLALGD